MPSSLRVFIAFALSALLHGLFFAGLSLMADSQPMPDPPESDQASESAALEVTVVPLVEVPAPAAAVAAPVLPEPAHLPDWAKPIGTPVKIEPTHQNVGDKEEKLGSSEAALPAAPPTPSPSPTPSPAPLSKGDLGVVPTNVSSPTPEPATEPNDAANRDPKVKAAVTAWNKAAGNAVMACWNAYRQSKIDLLGIGEVRIKFVVDAKGHVSDIRVLSNTGSPAAAEYAVRSVKEAAIPPIPPERLARLARLEGQQRVPFEFNFTIIPPQ